MKRVAGSSVWMASSVMIVDLEAHRVEGLEDQGHDRPKGVKTPPPLQYLLSALTIVQ